MPVEVRGLDEMGRALHGIDPRLGKAITRAHKEVSSDLEGKARSAVAGIRDAGGRGSRGIKATPTAKAATLTLLASNPWVRAAVMGAETHWVFGRPMAASSMSRRVWQPWVGNDWTAEEGLYGISPVIKSSVPSMLETYADRVMDALAVAFPNR